MCIMQLSVYAKNVINVMYYEYRQDTKNHFHMRNSGFLIPRNNEGCNSKSNSFETYNQGRLKLLIIIT